MIEHFMVVSLFLSTISIIQHLSISPIAGDEGDEKQASWVQRGPVRSHFVWR